MNRRGKSKDSGRRGQGAGREDDDEGHLDDDDDVDDDEDGEDGEDGDDVDDGEDGDDGEELKTAGVQSLTAKLSNTRKKIHQI